MKILLVRHGYDDFDLDDTSMGRGQMVIVADVMKSSGLANAQARIVASEHKRTMASAQVLADELGAAGVEEATWLTDGTEEDAYAELIEYADTYDNETTIIAVTHLPEIQKILEKLKEEYHVDVDADAGYGDTFVIDRKNKKVERMDVL